MLRTQDKKDCYKTPSLSGSWSRLMKRLQHKSSRQNAKRYITEKICEDLKLSKNGSEL